ncbi:MAG: hypothetical protein ACYTG0_08275 [Planctomycetota bacterium]
MKRQPPVVVIASILRPVPSTFGATVSGGAGLLLVVTTVLVCAGETSAEAKPAERPNVIVIVADDLGYVDLGVQGCHAASVLLRGPLDVKRATKRSWS